jgi:hypothetical protein
VSAVAAALTALLAAAPPQPVRRAIAARAPGRIAVVLDRDVYDRARTDLGDLRVVDDQGAHAPYLLEWTDGPPGPAGGRPRPEREVPLRPEVRKGPDRAGETVLTLDLGARAQPVSAVVFEVATPRFLREVIVEAPRPGRLRRDAPRWMRVASGVVQRTAGGAPEVLRVEARAREGTLRVRVLDRDDAPLDLRAVTLRAPVERVVFEARAGRSYALEYGRPGRGAPAYDLSRTVDAAAWSREAALASLGPPQSLTSVPRPVWADRHPALLLGGLAVAVAALAVLTWRAVRAAA